MISSAAKTPLEDIGYLARSDHRVAALDALTERPRSRTDLRELTGVSQSTIRRTLRTFEDRHWIRKDGHQYEATALGAFVAAGMRDLIDRFETERKLRDVWQWLPIEASGFPIGIGSDAVVTAAEVDDPYRPVNRFVSLLRETDRFRFVGFDLGLLEPCRDELARRIVDGMETEIIDPPRVAGYILSTYPEHCSGPRESDTLTVRLHDDLPPYGVAIFDRRIAISGHDPESGTVRVVIDTGAPEAREWAESMYESYRRDSRPLVPELVAE
ncbi:helix-turn-helix transcriptional regulator [Natrinema salsiterrestre]|uniref:Helix-turn-helix domain-containing protein n=1 Tax=Natrinema salsiterrestre TaxID=2950540 RepID=A0A9Q4KZ29_9EURY|nr:helix-turn-helix domain-containing protein [Natrinema salsiterrestre]MDF9746740.1 helix-turn-helix domain-containing protein [Natrinema salsiterrestre]